MGGDSSDTVEVYDAETKTWTLLPEKMPENLSGATACVLGTTVYLFGAKKRYEEETWTVHKFDTILREWNVLPIQVNLGPELRYRADDDYSFQIRSATKIGGFVYIATNDGDMLLFDPVDESLSPLVSNGPRVGGYTFGMDGNIYDVDWAEDYDEKENVQTVAKGTIDGNEITWSRIKNVPSPGLEHFGLASIENRDVLDDGIIRLKAKLARDKSSAARKRHMMDVPNAGHGYVFGRSQVVPSRITLYAYDPQEDTWDTMASMPHQLHEHSATAHVGTDIYVMSGTIDTRKPVVTMISYDSLTDTWTEEEDMIKARKNHWSAVVGKKLYVIGGLNSDTVEVYDTEEKTWMFLPESIPEKLSDVSGCVFGKAIFLSGAEENNKNIVCKFDTILREWRVIIIFNFGHHGNPVYMGSATKIGDFVYIVTNGGDQLYFDLVRERLWYIKSEGPRLGGHTFGMGGNIYDVDWADDYDEKKYGRMVTKAMVDGNKITWSRIKNVPSPDRKSRTTRKRRMMDA
jgi:hypothetical protein